jgi:hypothetical protein
VVGSVCGRKVGIVRALEWGRHCWEKSRELGELSNGCEVPKPLAALSVDVGFWSTKVRMRDPINGLKCLT